MLFQFLRTSPGQGCLLSKGHRPLRFGHVGDRHVVCRPALTQRSWYVNLAMISAKDVLEFLRVVHEMRYTVRTRIVTNFG